MTTITENLEFVKEQIKVQEKLADRYKDQEWRKNLHLLSIEKFKALGKDIENMEKEIEDLKRNSGGVSVIISKPKLGLSYDDVKDLPEELIKELTLSDADKIEFIIQDVVSECGGIADLNQILVGLYRKTKEVYKRNTITSRLYRMMQRDLIFSVPNRKGVYSTQPINNYSFDEDESQQDGDMKLDNMI